MSNEEVDDLQLRVAKAIPSDVGHGRARVPFDNDLNLKPGDIVEITGEQKTAAIVWRCRPEDANLGIIRVDGIIRKNAGVSLGDKVSIRKVETQPCQKLILSPVMAKQQKVQMGTKQHINIPWPCQKIKHCAHAFFNVFLEGSRNDFLSDIL